MADLSEAEVHKTCQRALFALGFPAGADDDAATALTWLSAADLGGVECLHDAVGQLRQQPMCRVQILNAEPGALKFNAREDAGFLASIEVTDMLCALASANESAQCRAHVSGLRFPLMLVAVAATRSAGGYFFEISSRAQCLAVRDRHVWSKYPLDERSRMPSQVELSVRCRNLKVDVPDDDVMSRAIQAEQFKKRTARRRIQVSDRIWAAVKSVAAESFVPASEHSRERGAGAGLVDND